MNTIPIRISAEHGMLVAMVRNGETTQSLRLVKDGGARASLTGRELLLGVRPECISLADEGSGGPGNPNHLSAEVQMIEPTGAETLALIRLGEVDVTAKISANARPAVCSRPTFAVDMSKACLFDPQTELRIS